MSNKILVIAEKPSVAKTIAKVLGAYTNNNGYCEGNGYIVSWCYGHLTQNVTPDAYDPLYKSWRIDTLPIIPKKFAYTVNTSGEEQFNVLKKLMNSPEVVSLVEATDAGREGELIFRLVYKVAECAKPFKRLWISSLEEKAIKGGFAKLETSEKYDNLFQAAMSRQQADWLVGINFTRLYTLVHGGNGNVLTIGRVQTPTLAMIVKRDLEIDNFKSTKFYKLAAIFDDDKWSLTSERFTDINEINDIYKRVKMEDVVIKDYKTIEKKQQPPRLYDLTSLQRDASKMFSITAKVTLDALQSLYEKKLATYPRTDSQYITTDMVDTVDDLAKKVSKVFAQGWSSSRSSSTLANNSKVSDHHAILPTEQILSADLTKLPFAEEVILKLISARLLASLSSPYVYLDTKVVGTLGNVELSGSGKTEIDLGWQGLFKKITKAKETDTKECSIPSLKVGQTVVPDDVKITEGATTPPARYTDDTLLGAMEKAGVEDMPEDAERKGLGTSATRAGIIEHLLIPKYGYAIRVKDKKGSHIESTKKGKELISIVDESVKNPKLTGDWEYKLLDVEKGVIERKTFMDEIEKFVGDLVGEVKQQTRKGGGVGRATLGKCPWCGGDVVSTSWGWKCSEDADCDFSLGKNSKYWQAKKHILTDLEASLLIQGLPCRIDNLTSSSGKKYSAIFTLEPHEEGDKYPKIKIEFPNDPKPSYSHQYGRSKPTVRHK